MSVKYRTPGIPEVHGTERVISGSGDEVGERLSVADDLGFSFDAAPFNSQRGSISRGAE